MPDLASVRVRGGYLDDGDVCNHLLAADACVFPFRKNASGRSSLMTAFALGMPVITTDLAPNPMLVDGENVKLVPPNNSKALSDAIKNFREESTVRQKLSAGAKALSKEFSWERIAARYEQVFSGVIDETGKS